MSTHLIRFCICSLVMALGTGAARADKLDDNLQTVWESLWTQGGAPQHVARWNKVVTYRIYGADASRHRDHLEAGLKSAREAAAIEMQDISAQADAESAAMLSLEVVGDNDLPDTQPCHTKYEKTVAWSLEKVQVKMRSRDAWRCAFHETMHAMGIPGHPSGKTVLSYFPYRRDVLMDLDKLMLKAWYSPTMRSGATPLEALVVMADAVVQQADLDVPAELAMQRAAQFKQRAFEQMEALASGQGEIPSIVLRSGRANETAMKAMRGIAGYVVGMAYLRGVIVPKDVPAATPWFKRSANYGYSAGQILWARALKGGVGVAPDPLLAHGWLSQALARNNALARTELDALEKEMSAEQIEKARSQPPVQLEPS
jgi:hypothetical protein